MDMRDYVLKKKTAKEAFPLTYSYFVSKTDMVYTDQNIEFRMKNMPLPFLVALECHFEENVNEL